jgi:2-methylcitrate dehydratase PrpD
MVRSMSVAGELARWAAALEPTEDDLALADRALVDTIATASGARRHAVRRLLGELPQPAAWATLAHVLDFDDLHMESTAHISAVCVPAALAAAGDARAYLAGAGVMARLGRALGWQHYAAGWHSTCTAGAPAAAAATAVAMGLDAEGIAAAMALAVPAAGGVQRAFGTEAKSLQVGFAAGAGARAARLAAEGATADPGALDQWLTLVGGDAARLDLSGPAVPGGLAVKLFPCCYALQRPISAMRRLPRVAPERVSRIAVRTPQASLQPLIRRPAETGLEGKFSLEYALAAAILDERPGLDSFTDDAVARPPARALADRVEVDALPGGDHLLAGTVTIDVALEGGAPLRAQLDLPPGAPSRPPSADDLRAKVVDCAGELAGEVLALGWADAAAFLRERLTAGTRARAASRARLRSAR